MVSALISGRREHFQLDGHRTRLGRITSDAEWPAIIGSAVSDRLRAMLGDPARRQNHDLMPARHLLTGFARCSSCESPMLTRYYARSGERGLGCVKHTDAGSSGHGHAANSGLPSPNQSPGHASPSGQRQPGRHLRPSTRRQSQLRPDRLHQRRHLGLQGRRGASRNARTRQCVRNHEFDL
jgi:hypothetical protein